MDRTHILRLKLLPNNFQGIKKQKRSAQVYDENSGEYKPRWGHKRANDETAAPWIEVPDGAGTWGNRTPESLVLTPPPSRPLRQSV